MIAERIQSLKNQLPQGVRLVAVSKFHPAEAIAEAYAAGQRLFGESRVQELQAKHDVLPKDIEWHFIGHLQTNIVKYLVPYVTLIHGIDSFRLLEEVNRQAEKIDRPVSCLLQIHIAREETKFGFSPDECRQMLGEGAWHQFSHVRIAGLMGMATNTDNMQQVSEEFHTLANLFHEVKAIYFAADDTFCELSMGMTHDYPQAVEAGSTLVRIGTYIFGERNY